MPNITSNPITVIPPKTSGGSVKNAANLIGYSAAAEGPQSELWGSVVKAFRDLQSQVDGIANSLRSPLGIPDPIQVVDPAGNLVANIGTYVNPLTNTSFSGIWTKQYNVGTDANPLAFGAVGDGSHDDTNALQQAWNQTGVLYLPPNKTFLISAPLTAPISPSGSGFSQVLVYGGGFLSTSVANPMMSFAPVGGVSVGNIRLNDVVFLNSTSGATCLSISGIPQAWMTINGCYFSPTSGTGISLTNLVGGGFSIERCVFQGSTTAISLNTPISLVDIVDCFFSTGLTTTVATSGAVTYNLKACSNRVNHYGAPVNRAYAESTATLQTITAGGGFTNITGVNFTIPATGVWRIDMNAFIQQTAGAANSASIRFSRNGTGDVRTAGGGNGSGQYQLHGDLQISLTSGDTIQLQCACGGANASVLGSGDQGMTNLSAWLIGDS